MIRKILYALFGISLVLAMNQIVAAENTVATTTTVATGTAEVRISASQTNEEFSRVDITISSVEIHLPDGWSTMQMGDSNKFDLLQAEGLEQVVATTNLNQGTYTQIRININKIEITQKDGQTGKAKLAYSRLTFNQNFIITAKNTTALTLDFDLIRSIYYSSKEQLTFEPSVNLLFTRTPGSMEIIPANLPNGEVGIAYYARMMVIGGRWPYSWGVYMGDLPPGLSLDPVNGIISGTPTVAGNFGSTIRIDDASEVRKNASRNYFVGIAAKDALQILTASLPDGSEKKSYSIKLQAVGGTGPYSWSLSGGSLPDGLMLDPVSGTISGTATKRGDFSFVIKITDNANPAASDTQNLSIRTSPEVLTR